MIIVLKNADFSENNIGTIDIPYELSDITKSYLTHVTKYNEDSIQAKKLDSFLNVLIGAGIYDKIKVLCLPGFASSLAECFYDLKRNEVFAPSSTSLFEVRNYGYGIKDSVTPGSDTNVSTNYWQGLGTIMGGTTLQASLSIGVYDATGVNDVFAGCKKPPYYTLKTSGVKLGDVNNYININADPNNAGSKGLRVFSWDGNTNRHINYCGLTEVNETINGSFTLPNNYGTLGDFCFNGYSYASESQINRGTVSMMFVGTYLTPSEMETLNNAANALFSFIP